MSFGWRRRSRGWRRLPDAGRSIPDVRIDRCSFLRGVGVQEKPGIIAPSLDSVLLRYSRIIDPALKKILNKRRQELMDMGWLEFWEWEEAVWQRLRQLMKQGGEIEQRLVPLEKKKIGLIREPTEALPRRTSPIRSYGGPCATPPAFLVHPASSGQTGEVKSLFDEWLLFQDLAQVLVKREFGRVRTDLRLLGGRQLRPGGHRPGVEPQHRGLGLPATPEPAGRAPGRPRPGPRNGPRRGADRA